MELSVPMMSTASTESRLIANRLLRFVGGVNEQGLALIELDAGPFS